MLDDALSGDCDLDIEFKNTWEAVDSSTLRMRSDNLDLDAGNLQAHGYLLTTSSCKFDKPIINGLFDRVIA